jgi:hypothetical protein
VLSVAAAAGGAVVVAAGVVTFDLNNCGDEAEAATGAERCWEFRFDDLLEDFELESPPVDTGAGAGDALGVFVDEEEPDFELDVLEFDVEPLALLLSPPKILFEKNLKRFLAPAKRRLALNCLRF